MNNVIRQALKKFIELNGMIHAASSVGEKSMEMFQKIEQQYCNEQLQTKGMERKFWRQCFTRQDSIFAFHMRKRLG